MKAFDIELAKQDHPLQTRDGRPVRIICYDRLSEDYPLVGLVKSGYDNPEESMHTFTNNGSASIVGPTDLDLFMAPTKKEGWINLYHFSMYAAGASSVYKTEEEALKGRSERGYILTKKIEWEE